jgi:hypothetical protein
VLQADALELKYHKQTVENSTAAAIKGILKVFILRDALFG